MKRIVDGATRLMAIIGDPVAQVRSPIAWSTIFHEAGVNAMCVPMHVRGHELETFFAGLRTIHNLFGLIVTIPHKIAVVRHCDALTDRARLVGSVNLMRVDADGRRTGDIVDGVGFTRALKANGHSIAGRRALVVGAGGVGTAIAFAIAEEKPASITVADVDAARAAGLAKRLEAAGTPASVGTAKGAGFDLAVNASPLGMRDGDALPIDLAGVTASTIVADVVNVPHLTPILQAARALGCPVQRGVEMMLHQVAPSAEFLGLTEGDWSAASVARALGE